MAAVSRRCLVVGCSRQAISGVEGKAPFGVETMASTTASEAYVLEGSFGAPTPTPPAGGGAAASAPEPYVNEGLARWNAGREAWLKTDAGASRAQPKDIEVDEVIETIFSPQFGGKVSIYHRG